MCRETVHHIIISGTGRSGTTFLVQLLTDLGFDTGFNSITENIDSISNAGMEKNLNDINAPYIVKSPWLCDSLEEIITKRNIAIDYAIIPIRSLFQAAESRRSVYKNAPADKPKNMQNGGLWKTSIPEQQESILLYQFYTIMHTLTKLNIPTLLLDFPRLATDSEYLYTKLQVVFSDLLLENFKTSFDRISNPLMIHDFKSNGGS